MKAVLLSIQPVWCSKIVLKEKTVEVRKTKPEGVKPPFKCYIYCTKEQSKMGWLRIVPGRGWQRLDGTVIGEFVCDKIWELAPICRAPDDVEEMACMDRDRIVRYLNKCHGWAWHIWCVATAFTLVLKITSFPAARTASRSRRSVP